MIIFLNFFWGLMVMIELIFVFNRLSDFEGFFMVDDLMMMMDCIFVRFIIG